MNCENCGLPPGALLKPGLTIQIIRRADNKFKRDSKATVWCCSEECAVQQYGISKYGKATSKWDISLNQIRAQFRRSQNVNDESRTPKPSRKAVRRSPRNAGKKKP